jgi:apolipoprotein N-acyltransferase
MKTRLSPVASIVFLALAVLLLAVSNGRFAVPLAAWVGPALLLRFTRRASLVWVLIAGPLAFSAASFVRMLGSMDLFPAPLRIAMALGFGLTGFIPYLFDRWAQSRGRAWVALYAFPAALTSLEFAAAHGAFGTDGMTPYSQAGVLWIMQLASITGIWGIAFLMSWVSSLLEHFTWPHEPARRTLVRQAWAAALSLSAVFVFGTIRVLARAPDGKTERIAGVAPHPSDNPLWRIAFQKTPGSDDVSAANRHSDEVLSDLLAASEDQIRAGARLVVWPEAALPLLKSDEPRIVGAVAAFAAAHHAAIEAAFGIVSPGSPTPFENRTELFSETGAVELSYRKQHLVPVLEAAYTCKGSPSIETARISMGRVAAAICFDADFPTTLRQASRGEPELIVLPSNDWKGIDPWHTQMVSFRAVELGCTVFRECSNGLSAAYDLTGREIAEQDYFRSNAFSFVADVPLERVTTLYALMGDWFGYVAAGLLVAIIAAAMRKSAL